MLLIMLIFHYNRAEKHAWPAPGSHQKMVTCNLWPHITIPRLQSRRERLDWFADPRLVNAQAQVMPVSRNPLSMSRQARTHGSPASSRCWSLTWLPCSLALEVR